METREIFGFAHNDSIAKLLDTGHRLTWKQAGNP